MKEAVAGELAAAYDSAIIDEVRANGFRFAPGGSRVHLAREFGFCYGVDRAVDYAYQARRRFPGPQRLPDRRDHPQPARQRPAARQRHPVPVRPRRAPRNAGRRRRGDPAGVRRHRRGDGAADRTGLHARGHHLRLGAERLEERHPLRAGRLHRDHSRQGEARGDPGDRVAGAEISDAAATSSSSTGRSGVVCDYIRHGGDRAAFVGPLRRGGLGRASIRTSTWSGSGAPTRRRC